ncbi:MAG TPA: ABC transporter permease [Woeseiaceae bacterium]|nr:ABC transporter permease [Woeseiaceae bacterium]
MFRYYLKLGLLSIRSNAALSALMVAAIGIGIGACMTIVTIYHVMSGNPIPEKSSSLYVVQIDNWSPDEPYDEPNEPPPQSTYLDATNLYSKGDEFRQVVSYKSSRVVQPPDAAELPFEVSSRATTFAFFPMFSVPFQYGSGWDTAADTNQERVVVLTQALNERLFGGENSVGEQLSLNGETYRIVGVLNEWLPTPKFYDLNNNYYEEPEEIYLPFSVAVAGEHDSVGNINCWKPFEGGYDAFLASECVWVQTWVELPTRDDKARYEQFLASYVEEQKTFGRFPRPLNNRLSDVLEWMDINHVVDDDVSVLLGLAFLFLIVCLLNTAGLLLAKVMRRTKDISLRRALGASKRTLFGQYIIEAGIIGVAGGVLGIAMTWLGLRGIEHIFTGMDFVQRLVVMDWSMVMLAVVLALVSAIAAALYPTWRAANVTPASQLRIQ